MTIHIFEDEKVKNLLPLTQLRPVYDLRCGILTLVEKFEKHYGEEVSNLLCREELFEVVKENNPDKKVNALDPQGGLFLNGRVLCSKELVDAIPIEGEEEIFLSDGELVGFRLKSKSIGNHETPIVKSFTHKDVVDDLGIEKKTEIKVKIINYFWDLVNVNKDEIVTDFGLLTDRAVQLGYVDPKAILVYPQQIFTGQGSKIRPGAILDADNGPIYIDEGAEVMHNAVIIGPAYVGRDAKVKVGAKIYDSSIGPVCKVGGEVEESVFHSYSNKQHDGFIGHSYIGSWVNLGADTNNSDLKNNYKNVKAWVNGEMIDSGQQFVGLCMGDHAKSGINTMFNTGTVVGIMSNVFGAGFPPKYVPNFSWGGAEGFEKYDVSKALEVAQVVMGRRGVELTDAYKKIIESISKKD